MQPKLADATPELPFDLPPLAQWLNPNEPLKILADTIDWAAAHERFAPSSLSDNDRNTSIKRHHAQIFAVIS